MKRESQAFVFRITAGVAAQLLLGFGMMLGILFSAGLVTGLGWAASPGLGAQLAAALGGAEPPSTASAGAVAPGADGGVADLPAGVSLPDVPQTADMPGAVGAVPGGALPVAPAAAGGAAVNLRSNDAAPTPDRLRDLPPASVTAYASRSYAPALPAGDRFDGLDAILAALTGAVVYEPGPLASAVRTADPTGTARVWP